MRNIAIKSLRFWVHMGVFSLLCVALFGCSKQEKVVRPESSWMKTDGRIKVLSTTAMIDDLVGEIGRDRIDHITLEDAPKDVLASYKESGRLPILPGQRVVVRFDLEKKPLAQQAWTSILQLIQRKFQM